MKTGVTDAAWHLTDHCVCVLAIVSPAFAVLHVQTGTGLDLDMQGHTLPNQCHGYYKFKDSVKW